MAPAAPRPGPRRRAGELGGRAAASASFRARRLLTDPRVTARLRARAVAGGFPADGRATVVVASWNTLPYLAVCLLALRRYGDERVDVLVVDNGSTDGSRAFVRAQPGVRSVRLPINLQHGPAMDLGFLLARTEYVVALDVDAFPVSPWWLDRLLAPLDEGAQVSGVHVHRAYAHPCALAMRRRRFVEQEHTFVAQFREEGLGDTAWDAGERISLREQPAVHLIERTDSIGPDWVGTTWGDVVFHNFYAARHRFEFGDEAVTGAAGAGRGEDDGGEGLVLDGIRPADAARAWDLGVRRHLGLDAAARRALVERWLPADPAHPADPAEPA